MFDFLFQNKKGEYENLLDIISADLDKIHLADLAQEKAMSMISKAISKSEIVLLDQDHNQRLDKAYYRLNVQPNDNQTGTDFWYQASMQLLHSGDVLIVRIGHEEDAKYYIAKDFNATQTVMRGKKYSHVQIWDGIDTYSLDRNFNESDVIRLRYGTDQLRLWRNNVLNVYNETLSALQQAEMISNTPLFKYKVSANLQFRSVDKDGNETKMTIDDVINKIKKQIQSGGLSIIRETQGTELEYFKIDNKASVTDLKSMAAEINEECAKAYDIPIGVFNGQITEQSDATNEFITYAVQPVAEVISDSLNAKIVGMDDYAKGERALVWLGKFKHRDVLDNADKMDKLRADGFSLDECREMVGMWTLDTDFSRSRVVTKNYAAEGESGKDPTADAGSDDADNTDELNRTNQQATLTVSMSKHKERRMKRNGKKQTVLHAD